MSPGRRCFLKYTTFLGASLTPLALTAQTYKGISCNESAYDLGFLSMPKTIRKQLAAMYGKPLECYAGLSLKAPHIAENKRTIPLSIYCDLPEIDEITVFASKNPEPLIGVFSFGGGAGAPLRIRLHLAQTSRVIVIAKSHRHLYGASRIIKIGAGCTGGGG